MQSVSQFSIVRSGYPFSVQNGVNIQSGATLSIGYVITGVPATLTITVEGCKNATGDVIVLDTYTGTANTVRSISLSDTYDFFNVTATWTGGTNVAVAVVMTMVGAGATFSAGGFMFPITGVGSPQNVISAPVGAMYTNTTGSAGSVLWVKTSGSGTSGWTAVA